MAHRLTAGESLRYWDIRMNSLISSRTEDTQKMSQIDAQVSSVKVSSEQVSSVKVSSAQVSSEQVRVVHRLVVHR